MRGIRVRLFAGLEVTSADISGVHVDRTSPPTVVTPESAPLAVTATLSNGSTVVRSYQGTILAAGAGGQLTLFNDVDLESYVASVLASEVSSGWHPEMLKAQAVAVRTYALRRMAHKRPASYDVVDDTTNQVYRGIAGIVPSLQAAATATAGQALLFEGQPADVWYHSACGGHTAASSEITGSPAPPYLQGVADADAAGHAFCAASPYFAWRNSLDSSSMARVTGIDDLANVAVTDRWPDGRVKVVRAQGRSGSSSDIAGQQFYEHAAAALGYKVVPSALLEISGGPDVYELSGHGVGHGVGMCQWGAQGRAKSGQTAAQILSAYFPGTAIAPM